MRTNEQNFLKIEEEEENNPEQRLVEKHKEEVDDCNRIIEMS